VSRLLKSGSTLGALLTVATLVEGDPLGAADATSVALLEALDDALALAVTANVATSRTPARPSVASR